MKRLEHEGIFKAVLLSWAVRKSDRSKSVGVNIKFKIVASLDGEAWVSWLDEGADEYEVWGTYWVVGRDGRVNMNACEQLVGSTGWDGSLDSVVNGPPPERVVQIAVKKEVYEGEDQYKAAWMNPEDYVPTGGMGAGEVSDLNKQFGSLLRGAAAKIAKDKAAKAPVAPAAAPVAPTPPAAPSTLPTPAEALVSPPATAGMTPEQVAKFDESIPFK